MNFRHLAVIAFAGALALPGLAWPSLAAAGEFLLRNQSEADIWHIYVSPDYASSWEDDLLDGQVLQHGAQARIHLEGYGDHCIFDLRIEDSDGGAKDYFNLNLCRIERVDYP